MDEFIGSVTTSVALPSEPRALPAYMHVCGTVFWTDLISWRSPLTKHGRVPSRDDRGLLETGGLMPV